MATSIDDNLTINLSPVEVMKYFIFKKGKCKGFLPGPNKISLIVRSKISEKFNLDESGYKAEKSTDSNLLSIILQCQHNKSIIAKITKQNITMGQPATMKLIQKSPCELCPLNIAMADTQDSRSEESDCKAVEPCGSAKPKRTLARRSSLLMGYIKPRKKSSTVKSWTVDLTKEESTKELKKKIEKLEVQLKEHRNNLDGTLATVIEDNEKMKRELLEIKNDIEDLKESVESLIDKFNKFLEKDDAEKKLLYERIHSP